MRAFSASRCASVTASAAAVPTMPATLCVPLRRSRSCPPPKRSGSNVVPSRTTITPTPFGPPNLCADNVNTSTCGQSVRRSIQHAACTASVCKIAFSARPRTAWDTSSILVMAPVSLLTLITETTLTSSRPLRCSRKTPASILPADAMGTTSPPTCSTQCNTAWCSAAEHTARPP